MFKTILIFLFLISSLWAESDLRDLYGLSEDIHNIVVEAAPLPDSYSLSKEESDRIVALGNLEGEIASYAFNTADKEFNDKGIPCEDQSCSDQKEKLSLQKRIKKRKFSVYYMGTFNSPRAVAQSEGVYGFDNYAHYMEALNSRGVSGAQKIKSLLRLENFFLATDEAPSRKDWNNLSSLERSKLLQTYASEQVGRPVSLGLILSEYVIQDVIAHPENWKEPLSQAKDYLSFDEKIRIASHFGALFKEDYNHDRSNDVGGAEKGVVTIQTMIKNLSTSDKGGVCRDTASAQGQILESLGVKKKDIFIASFRTAKGGHATLAVKDPSNPKNIVKLNYYYVTEEDSVGGGAVLTQDTQLPDLGSSFRVYDIEGNPMGTFPTEIGEVLRDVTNGRQKTLSKSYSLQKIGVRTPYGEGRVFTGRTSSGDNVVGVALNESFKNKYSEGEFGLVGVHRKGNRTFYSLEQDALYARLKYQLNTPNLKVGNFRVRAIGGLEPDIMVMKNSLTGKEEGSSKIKGTNADGSGYIYAGVQGGWKSEKGETEVRSEVISSGHIDFNNELEDLSGGIGPTYDNIRWTTGVSQKVTRDMRIQGEGTIVMHKIGSSALIEGAIIDDKNQWSLRAAYETPLDDLPAFMPGSSKVLEVGITKIAKGEVLR